MRKDSDGRTVTRNVLPVRFVPPPATDGGACPVSAA